MVNPASPAAIGGGSGCNNDTFTLLLVGKVNLYHTDFLSCPATKIAGAKFSVASTVAFVISLLSDVNTPNPNPALEILTTLALTQLSFPGPAAWLLLSKNNVSNKDKENKNAFALYLLLEIRINIIAVVVVY